MQPEWHRRCLLGVAMKPAINPNKHADDLGSSSPQRSPANKGLAKLRKELKRERKRERENVRFIDGWEQYKTLWDGIEFKRQLINMGDKKVRFALAIMAALNAVMLVVLTRGPIAQLAAHGLGSWLGIPLLVYGAITFAFMTHTIEALRPTVAESRAHDAAEWNARELGAARGEERPVGLFIRGSLDQLSFEEERRMWSNARLSDINGELILFNRSSSFVLKRQMEEIRKVYQRLKVLVILATVVLTLVVGSGVVRSGTGTFNALISLR